MDSMLYRRRLDIDIDEIRPELNILRKACAELRSSNKFKHVLHAILTLGNALNASSFRGGARGFQLEALLKMKETRTAKGGSDCPTLLHYLAQILMKSNPDVVAFVNDLPHVEAAARISVQNTISSVQSISSGLHQVNTEIQFMKNRRSLPSDDRFLGVMEPFVSQAGPMVDALRNMCKTVENDLHSLLQYYGENPESFESTKPEDFFALVMAFSTALNKAAIETLDAQSKNPVDRTPSNRIQISAPTNTATPTSSWSANTLVSPDEHRTISRGDLDEAIRSIRNGSQRRTRPTARPLSRIFLDGSRPISRMFDS